MSVLGIFRRLFNYAALSLYLSLTCIAAEEASTLDSEGEVEYKEEIIRPSSSPADAIIIGEHRGDTPPASFFTSLGSWIIVFVIMGATVVYLYRRGFLNSVSKVPSEKNLKVLETTALGGRQFLVLAKVRDREILLGVGQGFISKLESLDSPKENHNARFEDQLEHLDDGGHDQ